MPGDDNDILSFWGGGFHDPIAPRMDVIFPDMAGVSECVSTLAVPIVLLLTIVASLDRLSRERSTPDNASSHALRNESRPLSLFE